METNAPGQKLWVLKTVEDIDRTLKTVDHYNDRLNAAYNYDSKVANHKQVQLGDNIILIDKRHILGFAQIERIEQREGIKVIRKCPVSNCGSSTIDIRKRLLPKYRCNNGHLFDEPNVTRVSVTRYTAHYAGSFRPLINDTPDLYVLRPYYTNGYNQNMSMQLLAMSALTNFTEARYLFDKHSSLKASDALTVEEAEIAYQAGHEDERAIILRQIRERRGQQRFRDTLLARYGSICMVTGSILTDILEAAHINPYRGTNDHHAANGLLLRSDIHTLFDLNLLGIEPKSLEIHIANPALMDYGMYSGLLLRCEGDIRPSEEALRKRWEIFLKKC